MIKIGDKVPDATLTETTEFGEACPVAPKSVSVAEGTRGKRVVVFGLPGAYTPTCSAKHVPGYVEQLPQLLAKKVDEVWCVSLNDGFVMAAWGRDQKAIGKIRMLGDGNGELTKKLGLEVDLDQGRPRPPDAALLDARRRRRREAAQRRGPRQIRGERRGDDARSSSARDVGAAHTPRWRRKGVAARYDGPVRRVTQPAMALAALGACVAGCSLLVDLSGTTGGSASGDAARADGGPGGAIEDGAGAEGASRGDDADAAGTTGDGATAGGAATVDGSAEAGTPRYPPGSWCAENASSLFFCDDFDDGPLGARWTGTALQVSGAGSLSALNYRSPPYGFDVACPALMPSTFLTEVLTETIPPATRVALAFDFNPLMFPADGHGGTLYLATMTQGPGTPRSAIQFRAGTSLTDLQEQVVLESGAIKSGTGQWESATYVQAGTWTRVEIDLDFTTSPATAALRLAGQTVAGGTLDSSWTRAASTLQLGDWYIPTEPAFHVAYDDVTIALEP